MSGSEGIDSIPGSCIQFVILNSEFPEELC